MAAPRRPTFAFDLSKPLKKGNLLKQGAFHKAFKYRVFILYPGFLVYYKAENDWRLDLTKGDTLGSRIGAVKLKGATIGIARNAPKGCKFGLMINAPDPANKRQAYLMNASSKEERDSWIEAIRKATPSSPRTPRSDKKLVQDKAAEDKPKPAESKHSSSQEQLPLPPPYTLRQDTACEAAIAAASCTDENEEKKAINEMIDNVNSSLKESDFADELQRHNTATLAAISLAAPDPLENGLDEAAELETSIDVVLGVRDEPSDSSSSSIDTAGTSPTPNIASPTPDAASPEPNESTPEKELSSPDPMSPEKMTPDPEEATEMAVETADSSESGSNGKAVVTTVVTVTLERPFSPDLEQEKEGAQETQEDKEEEEPNEKRERSSSTQILVTDNENTTLSLNLNAYDSDDTLSDEESHEDLPEVVENGTAKNGSTENGTTKNGTTQENRATEKGSKTPSPKNSPVIAIKEERTGSSSSHSSNGSSEAARLAAPENQRRRSSTPFVEKRGYLYKMGGQRKNWKLRYFVVRPGAFNYFKDNRTQKALGEVKLKNLSIFFPGIGERKQSFQFTVHTESSWNKRADYVFAGQSEREMKEWITAFKLAGQKVGSALPGDSD